MKTTKTLTFICLLGLVTFCSAQEQKVSDTIKQMNLLDEQTKMLNQVFTLAGAGEDNPLRGATNYLELIERTEMSEEQKQQLRKIYDLHNTSLDPTKKAELQLKFTKMFNDAMDKSAQEN